MYQEEDSSIIVKGSKRQAATTASLKISKKQLSCFKRVSSLLRKKSKTILSEDESLFLERNSEQVKQFYKRQERRTECKNRLAEQEDAPEELERKCRELAQAIHDAEFLVVYTGAGISTAASIPDYRGPNGIWTRMRRGQDIGTHDLTTAEPTFTHMAVSSLYSKGVVRHVVSQNCDGLHLRSGLPKTSLSEVHGNMYIEVCKHCKPAREYVRTFDVTEKTSTFKHNTGRRCYRCGDPLVDTIVHFGERGKLRWPLNWQGACQASKACDTILCLGSSLKVLKKYPWLWQMDRPLKRRPHLYIINLQWTPKDKEATVKINGKCDEVMNLVMKNLGIEVCPYDRVEDPIFYVETRLHPEELSTFTQPALVPPEEDDNEVSSPPIISQVISSTHSSQDSNDINLFHSSFTSSCAKIPSAVAKPREDDEPFSHLIQNTSKSASSPKSKCGCIQEISEVKKESNETTFDSKIENFSLKEPILPKCEDEICDNLKFEIKDDVIKREFEVKKEPDLISELNKPLDSYFDINVLAKSLDVPKNGEVTHPNGLIKAHAVQKNYSGDERTDILEPSVKNQIIRNIFSPIKKTVKISESTSPVRGDLNKKFQEINFYGTGLCIRSISGFQNASNDAAKNSNFAVLNIPPSIGSSIYTSINLRKVSKHEPEFLCQIPLKVMTSPPKNGTTTSSFYLKTEVIGGVIQKAEINAVKPDQDASIISTSSPLQECSKMLEDNLRNVKFDLPMNKPKLTRPNAEVSESNNKTFENSRLSKNVDLVFEAQTLNELHCIDNQSDFKIDNCLALNRTSSLIANMKETQNQSLENYQMITQEAVTRADPRVKDFADVNLAESPLVNQMIDQSYFQHENRADIQISTESEVQIDFHESDCQDEYEPESQVVCETICQAYCETDCLSESQEEYETVSLEVCDINCEEDCCQAAGQRDCLTVNQNDFQAKSEEDCKAVSQEDCKVSSEENGQLLSQEYCQVASKDDCTAVSQKDCQALRLEHHQTTNDGAFNETREIDFHQKNSEEICSQANLNASLLNTESVGKSFSSEDSDLIKRCRTRTQSKLLQNDLQRIWFWGFDSCPKGTMEENVQQTKRVTRSSSCPKESRRNKCNCTTSNVALCENKSGGKRLPPDEGMIKVRESIKRRRTNNYSSYEPVFQIRLEDKTYNAPRIKKKKKYTEEPCDTCDEVEDEAFPDIPEETKKKICPAWYGKGYKKMFKKRKHRYQQIPNNENDAGTKLSYKESSVVTENEQL